MSAVLRGLGLFMVCGGHVLLGGALVWWMHRRKAATDEAARAKGSEE